jgi:hypothetical protein
MDTDGSANYELIKTGLFLVVIIVLLSVSIYYFVKIGQQNYQSSSICNVVNSIDSSFRQTLTYTANNQVYTKIVEPVYTVVTPPTLTFKYPYGKCTVYYPKNNPDDYTLNMNPITTNQIIASVLFAVAMVILIWFIYLKYNRYVAGVPGGIGAPRNIFSIFRRPSN